MAPKIKVLAFGAALRCGAYGAESHHSLAGKAIDYMIVVTGGLGSITGSILAGVGITVVLEWLRFVENPITIGDWSMDGIPGMRMVVFSLVLILVILFRREGIMGMREITWDGVARFMKRGKA